MATDSTDKAEKKGQEAKTIKRFATESEAKALPLVGQVDPSTGETIEKPYKSYDTSAKGKGLYLYCAKKGKTFRYDFTFNDKMQCLTIGRFGEVLTLSQARERLLEAKGQIAQGLNPCQIKQQNKRGIKEQMQALEAAKEQSGTTFSKVVGEWLEFWRNGKAVNTLKNVNTILTNHLLPVLTALPINQISQNDLLKIIRKIEGKKQLTTAKRTCMVLSQVFKFAKLHGYIEKDPTEDLSKLAIEQDEPVHYPAITEPNEVAEMLQKIEAWLSDTPNCSIFSQYAIRILCYLPLRIGELLGLTWSEVNLEKAKIVIPKERMKGKKSFTAYLSRQVFEMFVQLKALPNIQQNDFVFQSTLVNSHISSNSIKKAFKPIGISEEQSLNGFRNTFSSICNLAGVPFELIETCLANQLGQKVSQASNRPSLEGPRRKLMQWYADTIDSLRSDNVVIELDVGSLYSK